MYRIRKIILSFIILSLAASCVPSGIQSRFACADCEKVFLYSIGENDSLYVCDSVFRGSEVSVDPRESLRLEGEKYLKVFSRKTKEDCYVRVKNLSENQRDVVLESIVWTRTPASVLKDTLGPAISTFASKGQELTVLGYDRLDSQGRVYRYKVDCLGKQGFIYGKYTVHSVDEALYRDPVQDRMHSRVKNRFGGGRASGCDFFPVSKPVFKDNVMPQPCYCMYLNNGPSILSNIEQYIALAKKTLVNAFVIDIKDNERPGYKADAMKEYSPTNYSRASSKGVDLYSKAVSRLHEEGFYVIGRITCFKDTYFVRDNQDCAITDTASGKPFYHNKAYWPSAYNRRVWEFNVALALESIDRFGFDEINFDYVRFPDRMTGVEDLIDYHNSYDESKVQAIQRFVAYACDAIHEKGAYVSIDVFGESANPGYTTAYGQYWPALSNVADVMCGMPYPDHFANGFYGVEKPWNHPYEILSEWAKRVNDRQGMTPSPSKVRTWVQAYHVMKHVDRNGIDYDAENISKEIRALFDNGLNGGYMPWHASSTLSRYELIAPAFCIDYTLPSVLEN